MTKVFKALVALVLLFGGTTSLMASKRILVDLTHQIAIAYQDGKVKFYGRISSGKPGRETPRGSFYVREKDIDHISNLWPKPNGGAHMPYMLRITRDGVAMHLGPAPDYPASHGCIRMRGGFAQRMYAWAQKWTKVDIVGHAPAHSPAVALPAYARSQKVLRRSLGGGSAGPLAVLSSNPKDHKLNILSDSSSSKSKRSKNKKISRRKADRKNSDPLVSLGFHRGAKSSARHKRSRRKQKARKSRNSKRHHTKRNKHSKRNRHPNPLKAFAH